MRFRISSQRCSTSRATSPRRRWSPEPSATNLTCRNPREGRRRGGEGERKRGGEGERGRGREEERRNWPNGRGNMEACHSEQREGSAPFGGEKGTCRSFASLRMTMGLTSAVRASWPP